jgi:hypothetical protein
MLLTGDSILATTAYAPAFVDRAAPDDLLPMRSDGH